MEEYRIIQLDFKDRILKGYANKYSSGDNQSEKWKEFTKNVHKMQKDLYFKGFPCYEVGKIYDVNGIILFEEFSKKKITLEKNSFDLTDKETLRLLEYSLIFNINYFQYFQNPNDIFLHDDKKKLKIYDVARISYFTKQESDHWVDYAFAAVKPGKKLLIFKILSGKIFRNRGNDSLWKNLFLVESVRRKLVHHFRKDITLEIMASQSNADIISYGKKLQSSREKCLEEDSQKML